MCLAMKESKSEVVTWDTPSSLVRRKRGETKEATQAGQRFSMLTRSLSLGRCGDRCQEPVLLGVPKEEELVGGRLGVRCLPRMDRRLTFLPRLPARDHLAAERDLSDAPHSWPPCSPQHAVYSSDGAKVCGGHLFRLVAFVN